MDPTLIITAANVGASLIQAASGLFGPKAQAAIAEGTAIVHSATAIYAKVKDDFSATDQAAVDQALRSAHDTAGTDLDRVLGELDAAAKV